jgi:hypothetical protein
MVWSLFDGPHYLTLIRRGLTYSGPLRPAYQIGSTASDFNSDLRAERRLGKLMAEQPKAS